MWTLPAPRSAQATSIFLLYTVLALPGTALAAPRRDPALQRPALAVGAADPRSAPLRLMSIAVGYGMALAIPDPLVTNLVVNGLMFVVLLFSPIVYPASQLPAWLFDVQRLLPFYNMAVVVRAGLTTGVVANVGTSFLVLGIWTVVGWVATARVVNRRP